MANGVHSRTLVFLPNGLCLSKNELEETIKIARGLRDEILNLIYRVACNPRESALLAGIDLSQLKQMGILDERNQVSYTARAVFKACYIPQTSQWTTQNLRMEESVPLKLQILPRKKESLKIEPPPSREELLTEEELQAIDDRKIPHKYLNQFFIWRMCKRSYNNWCLKILESPVKVHLKGIEIIEELLKWPPSRERSQMALEVIVALKIRHPSLKQKAFRYAEPSDSSNNFIVYVRKNVSIYLERACLSEQYEDVVLIRENFAFLLVNKRGLAYFNAFLNAQKMRDSNREFSELINSLPVSSN